MKKYMVRNVGWVYDDSHFQNDGAQQIAKIFDSKKMAEEYCHDLERKRFISVFDSMHRHETWQHGESFADIKTGVDDFLIAELGCNPTLKVRPAYNQNSIFEYFIGIFPKKPTNIQLDKLMKKFRISFFTIAEFDDTNSSNFFYAFANKHYKDGYEEYLMNDGCTMNLFFISKYEAMKRFKKQFIEDHVVGEKYFFSLWKNKELKSNLEKLSHFPMILKDFIKNEEHLEYINQQIII